MNTVFRLVAICTCSAFLGMALVLATWGLITLAGINYVPAQVGISLAVAVSFFWFTLWVLRCWADSET